MATNTYEQIATTSLAGGETSISFTSIPNTFRDIILVCDTLLETGSPNANQIVRFNSDSGSNYDWIYMRATGSGIGGAFNATSTSLLVEAASAASATNPGSNYVYIFDYAQTDKYKPILVQEGSGGGSGISNIATYWQNSGSAITSISITLGNVSSSFDSRANYSLFGVRA